MYSYLNNKTEYMNDKSQSSIYIELYQNYHDKLSVMITKAIVMQHFLC